MRKGPPSADWSTRSASASRGELPRSSDLSVPDVDPRPAVGAGDDREAALDEEGAALGRLEHQVRVGEPGRAAQEVQVVGDRADVRAGGCGLGETEPM